MNKLEVIERGGDVKRYHAITTLRQDTVAQHSFHVAWIATLLWTSWKGDTPSAHLLLAALSHDLAEFEFGDIPAPTKRAVAAFERMDHLEQAFLEQRGFEYHNFLSEDERYILHLADSLDGLRFCTAELCLGNFAIQDVRDRFAEYVRKRLELRPDVASAVRPITALIVPSPPDPRVPFLKEVLHGR